MTIFNGGVHGERPSSSSTPMSPSRRRPRVVAKAKSPTSTAAASACARFPGSRRCRRRRLGHRLQDQVGRTFTYKGQKRSYLTASCPTGHYFTEGTVHFSGATELKITHVLPCTPMG